LSHIDESFSHTSFCCILSKLEEPADFPRYVDVQLNIEDTIEPLETEPPETGPLETEPLETLIEKASEESPLYNSPCIFFGDWHRAMQPSSNESPATALVDDTTTNWSKSKQSPLSPNEVKADWRRSSRRSSHDFSAFDVVDDASTFSLEESGGGLAEISVFKGQRSVNALDE
jgi:hypothetical protein